MVYNTQNYWVFALLPSSGVLENRKHGVLKTGSVSVIRLRREKTSTKLGPLDRANLNHSPFHLKTKTDPVSETSCFLFSEIPNITLYSSLNVRIHPFEIQWQ
jgi:hypothetical protein